MSKFIKNLIKRDEEAQARIRDRLKGEESLRYSDPKLQWATGGANRGRMNLYWGPSGSGKTAMALMMAAKEQQQVGEGYVLVFDSEYAHPGSLCADQKQALDRYRTAGLDPERCLIIQSNKMDVLFGDISTLEKEIADGSLKIAAIVVDSWGGIQSEGAFNKLEKGEIAAAGNAFGGNAKSMAPVLQSILRISAENGITCFCVQHCIDNMDQYGPRKVLVGGNKLKFLVHQSTYLESISSKEASLLSGDQQSENNEFTYRLGKKIRFRCEKTRFTMEGRKGEFWMNFEELRFALPEESLFELATDLGIIGKLNNVTYAYPVGAPTPLTFNGKAATKAALKDDKKLYDSVFNACVNCTKIDTLGVALGEELGIADDGSESEGDETNGNGNSKTKKTKKK